MTLDELNQADLIAEALVREIGRAGRWSAVVEAWQALLAVRMLADNMKREASHLQMGGTSLPTGKAP